MVREPLRKRDGFAVDRFSAGFELRGGGIDGVMILSACGGRGGWFGE